MLKIAVIIINYNSSTYTIECLNSILQKTIDDFSYKIYVVDNNSELSDYYTLKKYLKDNPSKKIELHRSIINRGFGGGNMFGYQFAAPCEYIAFVNNDTIFLNDCLQELYQYIKQNPWVGIVGGQSFNEQGAEIISFDHYASTVRQILGRRFLEITNKSKYPARKKKYQNALHVNTVSGSFMLIERESFNNIGGFDENIFLYYEETDLCLRLKKINKQCIMVPKARYLHYHGASTQRNMAIKKELKISLVYLIQKHYGCFSKTILLFYLLIAAFFSSILNPKKWTLFALYSQGAPLSKSLKMQQKISQI